MATTASSFSSYAPLQTHLLPLYEPAFVVSVPSSFSTASALETSSHPDQLHPSHALYASSDAPTGLLARVLANGLALEVSACLTLSKPTSGSQQVSLPRPVRFLFSSPVLATPSIFSSPSSSKIYVVCATEDGCVYRLSLPTDGRKWETILERDGWASEYEVRGVTGKAVATFHAADEQTLLLGMGDGSIVRVEFDDDVWTENELRPSSYLSSFTSLLPSFSSSSAASSPSFSRNRIPSSPSEIVSITSHLLEDSLGLAFSLSRDRKVRVWNLVTGTCVRTVDLGRPGDELLPEAGEGLSSFLRIVTASLGESSDAMVEYGASGYAYHLVTFLPASIGETGGRFVFHGLQVDVSRAQFGDITLVGELSATKETGGAQLRDFDLSEGGATMTTVWDVRGETLLQYAKVSHFLGEEDGTLGALPGQGGWELLASPVYPAFTASYFEDVIQSGPQSDPAAVFISHLFYPSRFSPSSLNSALESYTKTLVSALPASHFQPPALSASYPSLAERIAAIVGCQIQLETSPQTGEYLYAEFGKKMRIEWLGFLARCEEVERSARWPIGFVRADSGPVLVEREGLVFPAKKTAGEIIASMADVPDTQKQAFLALAPGAFQTVQPDLASPRSRRDVLHIASLGHDLYATLSPANGLHLEAELDSATASALPFAVEDVTLEIYATRVEPFIDDALAAAVRHGVGGAGESFESAAKLVLSFLLASVNPTSQAGAELSELGCALVSASIRTSAELRFRLARDVLLVLLFALNDADEESPLFASLVPLVSSALSLYHTLSNLRWLSTVRPKVSPRPGANGPDDAPLLERFGSLKMTGPGLSNLMPPPTVLHSLLRTSYSSLVTIPPTYAAASIFRAAQSFLASTSLSSPKLLVAAAPQDAVTADRLLQNSFVQVSHDLCERFPADAAMAYVKAKASLSLGQVAESVELFERVAAEFSPGLSARSLALVAVLPADLTSGSLVDYYRHVSSFYEARALDAPIVKFCNRAIEAAEIAPDGGAAAASTHDLWSKLFKSTVALGRFEDAYMILTTTPYRESLTDSISHLITVMCHAGEVDRLTQFTFVGFQDIVERTLAFKARHADPLATPNYLLILYSWHISRGDYRNAASAMYQQGRRLGEVNGLFTDIGPRRAKSYLLAINALSLVDSKHAWLAVPIISSDAAGLARKRRKLTSHIPEDKFSKASKGKDVEIIELEDIRREYNLVLSTLMLAERFPDSFQSNVLSAENAVALFVQAGVFDVAILTARQLQVDMTSIFERLAVKCIDAAHAMAHAQALGVAESLDGLDWLLTSPLVSSLDGPIASRAQQYLKIMLTRHDGPATFFKYRRCVLDRLLEADRLVPLPTWLVDDFYTHDPEALVRACLKYDLLVEATEHALAIARRELPADEIDLGMAGATRLPYGLFDVVLKVVAESTSTTMDGERAKKGAEALRRMVERRIGELKAAAKR